VTNLTPNGVKTSTALDAAYDAIIIGGGAAGLAAALWLGRAQRSALVLDSGAYRNAPAAEIHSFPTRDGTPPAEYRRQAHLELRNYPTITIRQGTVSAVTPQVAPDDPPEQFTVELTDGELVRGRRLLLATGLIDDLPEIPGLAEIWGRSALHCPYCHGHEVRNQPLAILGSGHAVRLALLLRRFSPDVVICTNGATELSQEDRELLAKHDVGLREEPVTGFVSHNGALERIEFAGGPPLARHAIFVASQSRQRSPFATELGLRQMDDGSVEVNEFQQTSVPGVWAAGDMARRPSLPMPAASVLAAAASGAMAGVAIDMDLLSADTGLPQPRLVSPAPAAVGRDEAAA
jgi:thioredoxin reductase